MGIANAIAIYSHYIHRNEWQKLFKTNGFKAITQTWLVST